MSHNKLKYLERLHDRGYRITRQRQVVLDAICQAERHATIAEIYYRAKLFDESIDRSTIYRAINLFAHLGLVNAAETENGERTFEIVQLEHHHHLFCKRCGADIEIENEMVEDFYKELQSVYKYQVAMDHLIVFGVCASCAAED